MDGQCSALTHFEGIPDRETVEAAEVSIPRQKLGDAVLRVQSGDVPVMNQVAKHPRFGCSPTQMAKVPGPFAQEDQRGRAQQGVQVLERHLELGRGVEDPRMLTTRRNS